MKKQGDASTGEVLVVAPIGKDAALAAAVLRKGEIAARICRRIGEAAEQLGDTTTAILLAEEALSAGELPLLLEALERQPPWSDLPVIILTSSGGGERMSEQAVEIFGPAGNVTLLERPLHGVTLVSAMKVALRARRRQYEVRELLEQREMVLSGISDAFSSLDRDWRYIYLNDRVAELAGKSKEEMLGRNVWEIFPEAVGTEFFKLAHVAMDEGRAVHAEFFHKPWERWLDTRIYPTKGGIVIFRADISERKKQELLAHEAGMKLQESETRLRLATEAAAIGTFDYYPGTQLLRFSRRAKELFGLPPETEVSYQTYLFGIHPDDRHIPRETVERVLQPGSDGHYEIEYRTIGIADGVERWVAEKGRVLLDETERGARFIGTLLEITEQKNAEMKLRQAKQEAEEANQAKDRFLAMLSHELRTPLTPVLMTIASLRQQSDTSAELRRDLELLQRNVELEALLIDDLLDLTRIAHGKLELHSDAVDVHSLLDHALTISAAELEAKQLVLSRRFEASAHQCWADAGRLQQVFWNLLKNAAKFTPLGGRLDVSTRNDEDGQIVIEIQDRGVGIEADLLPRIFDAFEQGGRNVTSQFGGLGLGLAISKRVVDLHGGTISAASAGPGQGATFTVTLHAIETSRLGRSVAVPLETSVLTSVEILLVEDHADTARVLRRILENTGFSVVHANSLTKAREIAGEQHFDLVISDLGLPDGSGLDLMRFLHTTHGLTGIALSGFGTAEDVAASSAAGFSEHLTKPIDWPQLRVAIDRLMATKTQNGAAVAAVS